MKKDWALLLGWAAGVFTAATVLVCLIFVQMGGRPVGAELLPYVVMSVILGPGPGLLLLSAWISARLKRRHAGGAGRGSTLALGALVGAGAGLPAVFLVPLVLFGRNLLQTLSNPSNPEALVMFAVAAISGAATGFTCAWRVSRPAS
jgi:hypothetical protein